MTTRLPLVVVPCGGAKRPGRHMAAVLYTGAYFRATLRAALALSAWDGVRVLSGKHGLLRLGDEVDSYEQRIDEPGGVSAETLQRQASDQGILGAEPVVVLAGSSYASLALQVWPSAATPLLGLPGMGYQMQRLKQIASEGRL